MVAFAITDTCGKTDTEAIPALHAEAHKLSTSPVGLLSGSEWPFTKFTARMADPKKAVGTTITETAKIALSVALRTVTSLKSRITLTP